MSPRHITAAVLAAAAVAAVPATASASIGDELWASNKVERTFTRYYPRYHTVANCDQESRTYFWCDVIGQNGDCFIEAHASVRTRRHRDGSLEYWVNSRSVQHDCY